ncbi:hypothetical protein BDN72DRAFT_304172 [Pluteus cervinus]|uniref:Uncharacterized protein n=1 Tax=Pluteus cervinus TaxID=181527 RepID=A0ACD3B4S3_9AGAR|nr:hypothetical protein BDN72DRAFT_304172 [Pluteus cervinus]
MTSSLPDGNVNLDTTFGALLIGGLVSTALWGVTCVQTYTYFTQSSRDRPAYKAIILFLFAMDTFDSVLTGHFLYDYMVTHSADPLPSLFLTWSFNVRATVSFGSDFTIRMMFAMRVYKFSNKNLVPTTWIVTFSLIALGSGLFSIVKGFQVHSLARLHELLNAISVIFAATVAADLGITISLCYLLHKSRTGFRRTDSLIRVLMMYTINTGAISVLDGSIIMGIAITMPQNFLYDIPYLPLGKLHLNSYLACLNAREAIRERFQMQDPIFMESQILGRGRAPSIESGGTDSGSAGPTGLPSSVVGPEHRPSSL